MTKENSNPYRPPRGKTTQEVDFLFMGNNHIGGRTGISLEAARQQGLIPEETSGDITIGSAALAKPMENIAYIDYPDEVHIQPPSKTTLEHWNDSDKIVSMTTSDGQDWLCAIGEEGEIFAATKATSDNPATNQYILFSAASDVLLNYRQDAAA
ncbi:MAG: hypothetical protein Q7T74_01425 [Candidatus Saccharibacteria bacterium]|nr:hypothetical protein [Candidatus Saccharibacteria bacterium]